MAALPPRDPRKAVVAPLRTVTNHSRSPVALARSKEAERVRRLKDPSIDAPDQPPSVQYAAARERLRHVDPSVPLTRQAALQRDPALSRAYWQKKAEDHANAVRMRSMSGGRVPPGGAASRSGSQSGSEVEPRGATTPGGVARRGSSASSRSSNTPRAGTARQSPLPSARVRDRSPLAGALQRASRTPSAGSNAPYGTDLSPPSRHGTPTPDAANGRRTPLAGSSPAAGGRGASRTSRPPTPTSTGRQSPGIAAPSAGRISRAVAATRAPPSIEPRMNRTEALRLEQRGRSPNARDPHTGAAASRRSRDLSNASARSALSSSSVQSANGSWDRRTNVPQAPRTGGAVPPLMSSTEARAAAKAKPKPSLQYPTPYGRLPPTQPPPGSRRIRTPSPNSALVRRGGLDTGISPKHRADLERARATRPGPASLLSDERSSAAGMSASDDRLSRRADVVAGRSSTTTMSYSTTSTTASPRTAGVRDVRPASQRGEPSGAAGAARRNLELRRVPPVGGSSSSNAGSGAGVHRTQSDVPPLRPRI